jgi:hypothetical protein
VLSALAAAGCSEDGTAEVSHDGSCFVYEQTSLCSEISWEEADEPVGWIRGGGTAVGVVAADTTELKLVRAGKSSNLASSPIDGRAERSFVVRDVRAGDEVTASAPSATANCPVPRLPPFESCTGTRLVGPR